MNILTYLLIPLLRAIVAAAMMVAFFLLILGIGVALDYSNEGRALCATDTECAALCPRADLTCDGGPQS